MDSSCQVAQRVIGSFGLFLGILRSRPEFDSVKLDAENPAHPLQWAFLWSVGGGWGPNRQLRIGGWSLKGIYTKQVGAPLVWSDGEKVDRQIFSLSGKAPFDGQKFRVPFDATGKKSGPICSADSAGNGTFTQPVHLKCN